MKGVRMAMQPRYEHLIEELLDLSHKHFTEPERDFLWQLQTRFSETEEGKRLALNQSQYQKLRDLQNRLAKEDDLTMHCAIDRLIA